MKTPVAPYIAQAARWPSTGRHILAHFDAETILVYQAYCPSIGKFAIERGFFGDGFGYGRMSWVKPNFLWMMYRSNWGQSEGQEIVLALRLRRTFFNSLLAASVPSSFNEANFASPEEWRRAVRRSDVRLQWDPDHLPTGEKRERRAVQLGLRGATLEAYGKREILEVIDMTGFVAEQRAFASSWKDGRLYTPTEQVYLPTSDEIARRIGLDAFPSGS